MIVFGSSRILTKASSTFRGSQNCSSSSNEEKNLHGCIQVSVSKISGKECKRKKEPVETSKLW